jgi:hypothetical protein
MGDKGDLLKMRQVLIYLGEDSYWVAECPSLPGCISQGKTKEETILNIKEAIQKLSGKKSYTFVKGDLKHGDADHVFGRSGHYFKVFG